MKRSMSSSAPNQNERRRPKGSDPGSGSSSKKPSTKPTPLPATVDFHGYEITIPDIRICWQVFIVYSCGHPVMEVSAVQYPGCDKPLVAEINRHMRACSKRCKQESVNHVVVGICSDCKEVEDLAIRQFGGLPGVAADGRNPAQDWRGVFER